jgi:hypothetical protein
MRWYFVCVCVLVHFGVWCVGPSGALAQVCAALRVLADELTASRASAKEFKEMR